MKTLLLGGVWQRDNTRHIVATLLLASLSLLLFAHGAAAHAVAEGDKGYIQEISGVHIIPFIYLGAKQIGRAHV